MSFKISNIKAKTNSVGITIKHPLTGEDIVDEKGKEVKVYLFGKASKEFREHSNARLKSAIDVQQMNKAKQPKVTVERIRKEAIEDAVALTDKFENLSDDDGNEIVTKEAIMELYSNPEYVWLLDFVREQSDLQENFINA